MSTNYKYLLFSLCISILFVFPYLIKQVLPIEHDTLFHLSRIEGLARSFKDGVFVARIYPYKNMNFGYGSPMFYSDLTLLLPALLYNLGLSISRSYVFIVFVFTFITSYFGMTFCKIITKHKYAPYVASILYVFNNYRITDVYVRGALGEVMGFAFLPIVLLGIYYVLYTNEKKWHYLAVGFTSLALTHNISFVLACICFLFFLLLRFRTWIASKDTMVAILKAILVSIGCAAFFIFPMLEQLASQKFFLSYYTSNSSLVDSSVELWKYFANTTVFGYGTHGYSSSMSMLVNPGYFLMLAPLVYLFKKDKDPFITHSLILGYVFLLLPLDLVPWNFLVLFGPIQFTWRLIMLSTITLLLPASLTLFELKLKPIVITSVVCLVLTIEGIWHIAPVLNRTLVIPYDTPYENLIDGSIIDPFYSAFYVRVELAGADYLPINSPDYRTLSKEVTTQDFQPVNATLQRTGTNLTIQGVTPYQTYILPITYYKGYQVFGLDEHGKIAEKVKTVQASNSLVAFDATQYTSYICRYEESWIQKGSLLVTITSLIALLVYQIKKKIKYTKG